MGRIVEHIVANAWENTGKSMPRFTMVVVIGAGLMGQYIALAFARTGSFVRMIDLDQTRLDHAKKRITTALATMADLATLKEPAGAILDRVSTGIGHIKYIGEAELILEAITENSEAKRALFASMAGRYAPEAVITSNTSALNVFELMPPEMLPRAAMTHFFVPPHIVPLVEVVASPLAEPDVLPALREYLTQADTRPVFLRKFIKGFIINRLQRAYNREAFRLVEEGYADAATIDAAVKASLAIRFPVMAMMEKNDQAGLDLMLTNIKEKLDLVNDETPPAMLERMVAAGELGFKSGKGFYDYSGVDKEEAVRKRDEKLLRVRQLLQELGAI